ncbi:MAG: glycosyltransferase [Holophagales bacterium]|nr:glycosyltransferase [Holophagales bacterium]MBK9967092.1 glycosyltransferase [Holophagales bacterium]
MSVRLAYLVSRYPAISHTFILREVLALRARGFEISVASINDPDRPDAGLTAEERAEAASTYYVKRHGVPGAFGAFLSALFTRPAGFFRGLASAVRLGGTDPKALAKQLAYFVEALMVGRFVTKKGLSHLHVHFMTPASAVGLLVSKVFPVTFSMTAHGPDELYDVTAYRLREKLEASRFVCTIGRYCRSQLMRLTDPCHWEKYEVTPLGVDLAAFSPRPFREAPDPFEVICVGRLVPAKGQHVLLSAVAGLVAGGRRILLRFVGDGPDRASLEEEAKSRGLGPAVVFEGSVNQDRIRALYGTADVFALASFAEGIPVVLMEAMAMEIPCVTTFITGIPELIRDGVDGLLVAPSDEEALAGALARLMDDPALRRTLGPAGRRRVAERYELTRNVEVLAKVFQKRLGEAS